MSTELVPPVDGRRDGDRFAFLDALRGLAALAVLSHHLYVGELQIPLYQVFPALVRRAFTAGIQGFHVFFVISGFVIAHALRDTVVTAPSGASFMARRLVRLTPAYWVVLVPYTVVLFLAAWHHDYNAGHPMPTVGGILANALYLQELLRYRNFVTVSWTLCLEVQCYLFFLLLLWAGQRSARARRMVGLAPALVAVTAVASVAAEAIRIRTGGPDHLAQTWFVYPWCAFGLGALAYWSAERGVTARAFAVIATAAVGYGAWARDGNLLVPGATAVLIYAMAITGRLRRVTLGRVVQYFGTISYSLYLVHMLVLARVFRAGVHLTGLSRGPAVAWFAIGAVASVAVAHGFYLLVERPTRRLAARWTGVAETAPPTSVAVT